MCLYSTTTHIHLSFLSYSSHEDRREVKATSAGVAGLPLSPDIQISIIIHGYTESSFRAWVLNLTDGELLLSSLFFVWILPLGG